MEPNINFEQPKHAATVASLIMQAERKGMPFKLSLTDAKGERLTVMVTRPSLAFLAQSNRIPKAYRDVVDAQIKAFGAKGLQSQKMDDKQADALLDQISKKYGFELATLEVDMVNATCIAGFVSPRLVADEAHRDVENNILWVEDIPMEDREAYFDWCNKQEADETALVKSPDGGQPAADPAGYAHDGQDVWSTPHGDVANLVDLGGRDEVRPERGSAYVRGVVHREDAGV